MDGRAALLPGKNLLSVSYGQKDCALGEGSEQPHKVTLKSLASEQKGGQSRTRNCGWSLK